MTLEMHYGTEEGEGRETERGREEERGHGELDLCIFIFFLTGPLHFQLFYF